MIIVITYKYCTVQYVVVGFMCPCFTDCTVHYHRRWPPKSSWDSQNWQKVELNCNMPWLLQCTTLWCFGQSCEQPVSHPVYVISRINALYGSNPTNNFTHESLISPNGCILFRNSISESYQFQFKFFTIFFLARLQLSADSADKIIFIGSHDFHGNNQSATR